MPLLSSPLPQYTGPYDVGTVDIEAPCEHRRLADNLFKSTQKPAFELETVLFALYYPAIKDAQPKHHRHKWLPNPIMLHGEGYARFAHVNNYVMNRLFTLGLWTIAGSTTIPAKVDVPLDTSASVHSIATPVSEGHPLPQFPVIVFSHGVASHRGGYTQYCAELASRGYIVAAIEHRDGSGPGTVVMRSDGTQTTRYHFGADNLDPKPEISALKMMQLAMREAEVEETVRVLRQINDGLGEDIYRANPRGEGATLSTWKGRLNTQRMVIAGHSYGATLALQTLKNGPVPERPFVGCITFDPGKHSGPLNDDIDVPIVVVHSNSWSAKFTIFQGRPHFDVVKDLVQRVTAETQNAAWFLTARGTTHPSVTDAPLVEPLLCSWTTGATINVREGLMQYVRITTDFLAYLESGVRTGILKEAVTHPEYDRDARHVARKKCMSDDFAKYWQIHVAPRTDPKDVDLACAGLDSESTLVIKESRTS